MNNDNAVGSEDLERSPQEGVAPTAKAERIESLDFIRGIAVMGILVANIIAFGQPFNAYIVPSFFPR